MHFDSLGKLKDFDFTKEIENSSGLFSYDGKNNLLLSKNDLAKAFISDKRYFRKGAKIMNNDLEQATKDTDSFTNQLVESLFKLTSTEKNLTEASKQISSSVRQSADKLNSSMKKISDSIDLGKLEKQAILLERISVSMTCLSKLQDEGKLEKIINSIK